MAENMEKIHVGLYGGKGLFGGKEVPLRAEIVFCDRKDECDFYKKGKCLNVTAPLSTRCKFGSCSSIQGYTSRAKKYSEFRRKYTDDPMYDKLKSPHQTSITIIGDWVCIILPHAKLRNGTLDVPYFDNNVSWVEKDKFDIPLIKRFCEFRPHAMMGGEISAYRLKHLPDFLLSLRREMPTLYDAFIKEYPQYDFIPNYIGKRALLCTINPGKIQCNSQSYPRFNETWEWDGEYLTHKAGYISSPRICNKFECAEYRIKPAPDTYITITNNDQVNDNTIFES